MRLLMPLAMLCFRSKSISVIVVSIMNFTLKLAYLYKLTEKKCLIYMHLLSLSIVLCGLPGPQERSLIDSSRIWSSVYSISIISEKKRLVYMHIMIIAIIILLLYGSVLWLTRPSRKR